MGRYCRFVNSERLKIERYKKKLNIKKMSQLLGWNSPASYKNIEDGIVEPRISIMIKISKILGKPVIYFFNFDVQESCTFCKQEVV